MNRLEGAARLLLISTLATASGCAVESGARTQWPVVLLPASIDSSRIVSPFATIEALPDGYDITFPRIPIVDAEKYEMLKKTPLRELSENEKQDIQRRAFNIEITEPKGDVVFLCSGGYISGGHVGTASHCLDTFFGKPISVVGTDKDGKKYNLVPDSIFGGFDGALFKIKDSENADGKYGKSSIYSISDVPLGSTLYTVARNGKINAGIYVGGFRGERNIAYDDEITAKSMAASSFEVYTPEGNSSVHGDSGGHTYYFDEAGNLQFVGVIITIGTNRVTGEKTIAVARADVAFALLGVPNQPQP